MTGACHPQLPDTLNRLTLVETRPNGKGEIRYLARRDTAPPTQAGEIVLYAKEVNGRLELFFRREADGEEVLLSGSGAAGGQGPAPPPGLDILATARLLGCREKRAALVRRRLKSGFRAKKPQAPQKARGLKSP